MTQIEQMITDSLFNKKITDKNPVNHPNPENPDSDRRVGSEKIKKVP